MELFGSVKSYPEVILEKGREKRLLRGHKWVYSNELTVSLKGFAPGSWVRVMSAKGVYLGLGYVNPNSLIAVRIFCPPGKKPTLGYFQELLSRADSLRRAIFRGSEVYRMFFGESDGLPGFVVDKYEDVLVYQANTQGITAIEPQLLEMLVSLFRPSCVVYRNDSSARQLEGLDLDKGIAFGGLKEDLWVNIDGLWFSVDPIEGQKTGLYLDQRENRKLLKPFVEGKRVLDLFCYDGAWSIHAALYGARYVVGVDQSAWALERARVNAKRNGVEEKCSFIRADVFDFLRDDHDLFDVIVCDPPAFAKNKKTLANAIKGYTDLNRRAMLKLTEGGVLVTCSCSHHLSEPLFHNLLVEASLASGRRFVILEIRGQSPDHPIFLPMPETRYLKCFVLRMI